MVIIEPYWNWNINITRQTLEAAVGYNWTLLELKLSSYEYE